MKCGEPKAFVLCSATTQSSFFFCVSSKTKEQHIHRLQAIFGNPILTANFEVIFFGVPNHTLAKIRNRKKTDIYSLVKTMVVVH